jgi:hypothetical protein
MIFAEGNLLDSLQIEMWSRLTIRKSLFQGVKEKPKDFWKSFPQTCVDQ